MGLSNKRLAARADLGKDGVIGQGAGAARCGAGNVFLKADVM